MQNEKAIKWLQKSLLPEQIILGLESIAAFVKNNKTTPMHFSVTSKRIILINNSSIFRQKKLEMVKTITISALSDQIIFHTFEDDQSWFQCKQRVRIIANFLLARKKFVTPDLNYKKGEFSINISAEQSLEDCVPKIQGKAQKFLSNIFARSSNTQDSSTYIESKARQSDKFVSLTVNQKNFALKVGQKIYQMTDKKKKLLYISPKSQFIFNIHKLQLEYADQSKTKFIYTEKVQESPTQDSLKRKITFTKQKEKEFVEKQKILVEKIPKINQQDNEIIRQKLMHYKNLEYKEEILFAIETSANFKIVTTLKKNFGHRLIQNFYTLQIDLKSIFHRLISLIQNSNTIIYGLTPQKIHYDDSNRIYISEFHASLKRFYELDYVSPQELQNEDKQFTKEEIQLINLWKAGVLLYQLAYGNTPFTAYYIAYCLKKGLKLKVRFPITDSRSLSLRNFIVNLLQINPKNRGGAGQQSWKQKMFNNKWISSPI